MSGGIGRQLDRPISLHDQYAHTPEMVTTVFNTLEAGDIIRYNDRATPVRIYGVEQEGHSRAITVKGQGASPFENIKQTIEWDPEADYPVALIEGGKRTPIRELAVVSRLKDDDTAYTEEDLAWHRDTGALWEVTYRAYTGGGTETAGLFADGGNHQAAIDDQVDASQQSEPRAESHNDAVPIEEQTVMVVSIIWNGLPPGVVALKPLSSVTGGNRIVTTIDAIVDISIKCEPADYELSALDGAEITAIFHKPKNGQARVTGTVTQLKTTGRYRFTFEDRVASPTRTYHVKTVRSDGITPRLVYLDSDHQFVGILTDLELR